MLSILARFQIVAYNANQLELNFMNILLGSARLELVQQRLPKNFLKSYS